MTQRHELLAQSLVSCEQQNPLQVYLGDEASRRSIFAEYVGTKSPSPCHYNKTLGAFIAGHWDNRQVSMVQESAQLLVPKLCNCLDHFHRI